MISFIIPAYNEEAELPATLRAVREANEGADWEYEIVVADDGSTDATAGLAREQGARVVPINRRQIAAARNAGARAARGDVLIFVDADTQIRPQHVRGVIAALGSGCAGGGAILGIDRDIPFWGKVFFHVFCAIYFGLNLGAGAFLFTTRKNFEAVGGFDETYFAGEEIYFTLALRKIGRFKLLRDPVMTSGRKLRLFSRGQILRRSFAIIFGGPRAVMSRAKLDLWYGGEREEPRP